MKEITFTAQGMLAFDKGHWAVAEVAAQEALRRDPKDASAWNLLGKIAMLPPVNLPEHAVHFFERAIAANPGFKPAARNLTEAKRNLQGAATTFANTGRVVLIRDWGSGFFSDVANVVAGLLFAEITGRTPIVFWGPSSLFSDGRGNAWESFFEPIGGAPAIPRSFAESVYPRKWQKADPFGEVPNRWDGEDSRTPAFSMLGRPERAVVLDFVASVHALAPWIPEGHRLSGLDDAQITRRLVGEYVRPLPSIVRRVDELAAAHFGGRPMIAVHLRGSDKLLEMAAMPGVVGDVWNTVFEKAAAHPEAGLFILTDSVPVLEEARARFGDRMVHTSVVRTEGSTGVHHLPEKNRRRLGEEVLIDALLACRCESFVGMGFSHVGCFVRAFRGWAPGACTLVGPIVEECPQPEPFLAPAS